MTLGPHVLTARAAGAGLVLALAGGLLVAASAPTYADTRTTPDAVGDPVRTTFEFGGEDELEPTTETAPRAKRVDLISTRYDYRRTVLVVQGTARAAGRGADVSTRVRTAGQDYFFSDAPGGRVRGFRVSRREGEEVRCAAGRSSIDPGRGTYRLRIPAACFGSPDSVRLGFALSQSRSTRRASSTTFDDANRTGGSPSLTDLGATLGPSLARGAAARKVPDATGDPVRTTFEFDGDEPDRPTTETTPEARKVDLVSTRYDYRRTVLVVRGTAEAAGRAVRAVLRVRAAGEEFYFFKVGGGKIAGFGTDGGMGGEVRCAGGSSSVDPRRGTYQLRVPVGCFGSPEKARFGFGLARSQSTRRMSSETVDDANRTGLAKGAFFGLKLGSALARG